MNFGLRGRGDFPFDTSDRSSGNARGLAEANDWWGAATCPRSIIVVAGDTFADALAASSLSDPTDRSDQPRAQRVASADPLFDPIGGFDRIETAYAPIVVTDSGRSGATGLAETARLTASDLARGGCTTAREAIIAGGYGAVPQGVESELVSLGYQEVFRIAGSDRYDTAARIATALGTEAVPEGTKCLDSDTTDGSTHLGFYGNAAPEYRFDTHQCTVFPRSVVLADGGTGADALAAGWWTSRWQVPVLLTAPDGSLPPATQTALQTLDIDTLIVLGGLSRIPESTFNEAVALASASRAGRIAGADRYETSVEMAKLLGGWQATGDGSDFANDMVCIAGSSGSGPSSTGWPDALSAGPWCARLATAGGGSPDRGLPPVTGAEATRASAGNSAPSHDAIPILLVPTGATTLPSSAQELLATAFEPTARWCSAEDAGEGCVEPGFAVLVAGEAAVSEAVSLEVNDLVSGGFGGDRGEASPQVRQGFATKLDLGPIFTTLGTGTANVCFGSAAFANVRWLSVTPTAERRGFDREFDLLRGGRYGSGRSLPTCAAVNGGGSLAFTGVSLSGNASPTRLLNLTTAGFVALTGAIEQIGTGHATSAGVRWSFSGGPITPVKVARGGESQDIRSASLDLQLTVADPGGSRGTFTGTGGLATPFGELELTISGEATLVGHRWEFRGRTDMRSAGTASTAGGFRASVAAPSDSGDVRWEFDGYPNG